MNYGSRIMNKKGQVLIILLLVILVTLTVGLAVVQTSITDVSTSTKTEQSSRAFSAAEAGLERALLNSGPAAVINLGNDAGFNVTVDPSLPGTNEALEYPPITKADFAHFWLADPDGGTGFTASDLVLSFGNCDTTPCWNLLDLENPPPAVEVNIIVKDNLGNYKSVKKFFDSVPNSGRTSSNNFTYSAASCLNATGGFSVDTTSSNTSKFLCSYTVTGYKAVATDIPQLARVRILYANTAQKVALGPLPTSGLRLPPQADIYTSTGTAGDTVRQIKVFRERYVVPPYFDYAIFSAGEINK